MNLAAIRTNSRSSPDLPNMQAGRVRQARRRVSGSEKAVMNTMGTSCRSRMLSATSTPSPDIEQDQLRQGALDGGQGLLGAEGELYVDIPELAQALSIDHGYDRLILNDQDVQADPPCGRQHGPDASMTARGCRG
jgi:hypothetical protein